MTDNSTRTPHPAKRLGRAAALARLAMVVGLVLTALLGFPGAAAAHTELASSDPVDGASLTNAPAMVTLTFTETVQNFVPTVVVTGPDGQSYTAGEPTLDQATITTRLTALGPAGNYTVAYRIVSADDHPVSGQTTFTYKPPAASTPASTSTSTRTSDAAAGTTSSRPTPVADSRVPIAAASTTSSNVDVAANTTGTGIPGWIWLACSLVLVLGVIVAYLFARKIRRRNIA